MEMRYRKLLAAGLALLCGGTANAAEESFLTLALGYESNTGKYGTTSSTDIETVPLSALYESGRWGWKLTVPFLRTTGEGTVIASGGGRGRHATTTTTTTTTTRTTRTGLGDVVAMAIYNLYAADEVDAGMDMALRAKFGTADKTMGTGENDYAVQMYAYHALGDFTPSLLVGYEMLGDSAEFQFDNVYYGVAGANYRFSERADAGVEYRYAQQASATSAEQREAFLYLNYETGQDVFLRMFLQKGYANGSPDSGFGLALSAVY